MTAETSNARGEWSLVPHTPTPEMIEAGILFGTSPNKATIIYQSMVNAAPPPAAACPNCDDTGDVTRADGEWRGVCTCPAGQPPAAARGDVRGLVAKWEAGAATARDDANYSRAGGIEDCADELKAALSGEGAHRAQNTGLLDAIEQYAAAVEQDVRSKLRFTSYAARESAKQNRKKKKEAVRSALAAEGVQAGEVEQRAREFDFAAHLARQRQWSGETFGPGARTAGVCDHIRKELREIEAAPNDGEEWIDVVILALDGAWRCGMTPQQIIDGIVAKQAKNERRAWPDWRTADPNKAIEHDRSGEQQPEARGVVDGFEAWARAQMAKHGPIKTVSGKDVYSLLLPPVDRNSGVDAAITAAITGERNG